MTPGPTYKFDGDVNIVVGSTWYKPDSTIRAKPGTWLIVACYIKEQGTGSGTAALRAWKGSETLCRTTKSIARNGREWFNCAFKMPDSDATISVKAYSYENEADYEHDSKCCWYLRPTLPITCDGPTPNFDTGCELLKFFDADHDGIISATEKDNAWEAEDLGYITSEEAHFVEDAYDAGSINALCPGCYVAPSLEISPTTHNSPAAGDTFEITVTSNIDWTVVNVDDLPWISFTPASGSGDGTITVTIAENLYAERTGTIRVTGSGIKRTCTITQASGLPGTCDQVFYIKDKDTGEELIVDAVSVDSKTVTRVVTTYYVTIDEGGTYTLKATKEGYNDLEEPFTEDCAHILTFYMIPTIPPGKPLWKSVSKPYWVGDLVRIDYEGENLVVGKKYCGWIKEFNCSGSEITSASPKGHLQQWKTYGGASVIGRTVTVELRDDANTVYDSVIRTIPAKPTEKDTVICDFDILDAEGNKVTDLVVVGVKYIVRAWLCWYKTLLGIPYGGCAEILEGCDAGYGVKDGELTFVKADNTPIDSLKICKTFASGWGSFYWTPKDTDVGTYDVKLKFDGITGYNACESKTKAITVKLSAYKINVTVKDENGTPIRGAYVTALKQISEGSWKEIVCPDIVVYAGECTTDKWKGYGNLLKTNSSGIVSIGLAALTGPLMRYGFHAGKPDYLNETWNEDWSKKRETTRRQGENGEGEYNFSFTLMSITEEDKFIVHTRGFQKAGIIFDYDDEFYVREATRGLFNICWPVIIGGFAKSFKPKVYPDDVVELTSADGLEKGKTYVISAPHSAGYTWCGEFRGIREITVGRWGGIFDVGCSVMGIDPASPECSRFWEEMADPVYVADCITGVFKGVDIEGNEYHPGAFELAMLPVVVVCAFLPMVPGATITKRLGKLFRKAHEVEDVAKYLDEDSLKIYRIQAYGEKSRLDKWADAVEKGDLVEARKWRDNILENPVVKDADAVDNFNSWLDELERQIDNIDPKNPDYASNVADLRARILETADACMDDITDFTKVYDEKYPEFIDVAHRGSPEKVVSTCKRAALKVCYSGPDCKYFAIDSRHVLTIDGAKLDLLELTKALHLQGITNEAKPLYQNIFKSIHVLESSDVNRIQKALMEGRYADVVDSLTTFSKRPATLKLIERDEEWCQYAFAQYGEEAERILKESGHLDEDAKAIREATTAVSGKWADVKELWHARVKNADDVVYVDLHLAKEQEDFRVMHNLMRYSNDEYIKALKSTDAAIPEFANRFDEGIDFMTRHISEKGEPHKYAQAMNAISEAEKAAIKTHLSAEGKTALKKLIDGLDDLSNREGIGGLYDGFKEISDDVADVAKTGTEVERNAARNVVDNAVDFIDTIEKDAKLAEDFEKSNDVVKAPTAQRFWNWIKKTASDAKMTWGELTFAQKARFYLRYVFLPGCFGLFIAEETIQWLGFGAIPLWHETNDWEHKTIDQKNTALTDLEWFLDAREGMHTLIGFTLTGLTVTCPFMAPLYWLFHDADRTNIEANRRTIEYLSKDINPITGVGTCRIAVRANVSGVHLFLDGNPTGKLAGKYTTYLENIPVRSEAYTVTIVGAKTGYLWAATTVDIQPTDVGKDKEAYLELAKESNVYTKEPETTANPFDTKSPPSDDDLSHVPAPYGTQDPDAWFSGNVGDIICKTNYVGADIWLDGKQTKYKTNCTLKSIKSGDHKITFKKPGYGDCTVSVTVKARQTVQAYCDLVALIPPAPPTFYCTDCTPTTVKLYWSAPTIPPTYPNPIKHYEILKGTVVLTTVLHVAGKSAYTYQVTGLTPNTEYFFQIRTVDSKGIKSSPKTDTCTTTSAKPTAKFTFTPAKPDVNQTITFNATDSVPNDTRIVSYDWDWGDDSAHGTKVTETHAYGTKGTYRVILTVENEYGKTDSVFHDVIAGLPTGTLRCKCSNDDEFCKRGADIYYRNITKGETKWTLSGEKTSSYPTTITLEVGDYEVKYDLLNIMGTLNPVKPETYRVTIKEGQTTDFSPKMYLIINNIVVPEDNVVYEIPVTVTEVLDGDSFRVSDYTGKFNLDDKDKFPPPSGFTHQQIRIAGYDAFEMAEHCGEYSKKELEKYLTKGKTVTLQILRYYPLGKLNRVLASVKIAADGIHDLAKEKMIPSCLVKKPEYTAYYNNIPALGGANGWCTGCAYQLVWKDPTKADCISHSEYKPLIVSIDTVAKTFGINNRWLTLYFKVDYYDNANYKLNEKDILLGQIESGQVLEDIHYFDKTYLIKLFASIDIDKPNWVKVDEKFVISKVEKTVTLECDENVEIWVDGKKIYAPPIISPCEEVREHISRLYGTSPSGCDTVFDFDDDGAVGLSDLARLGVMSKAECEKVLGDYDKCIGAERLSKILRGLRTKK